MTNLFKDPVSGIIDSVSKGVETVAGVFTSNKEKDAQRYADEQMALMRAYQAEFNQRQNRTWVDSIADSFNRLIRPFIVCLILFIFIIAYISPAHMAKITLAMSTIPEGYWTLLSVIIAFYFGGRMQLKSQQFKFNESQSQAVKALIETKKEFRKLEIDSDEPDKIIGDIIAKTPEIEANRTAQINAIVETALENTTNKTKLAEVVENLKTETPEQVKKRRKFGPRKIFSQYH